MEELVQTTQGPLPVTQLIRRDDSFDEAVGVLTAIEYCLKDCDGPAHKSGQRDAPGHFCSRHVHRSVNLAVREGLEVSGLFENLIGA